jgi:hypothetical protein
MIDHIWTVLCSRAVIDRDSNNVSLQNVLEQINLPFEPDPEKIFGIEFDVISLWKRADPETPVKGLSLLTIISPSGKEVDKTEIELNLTTHQRLRTRRRFVGLPITETGQYIFKVKLQKGGKWRNVASIPLDVLVIPPESDKS